jgi:hypothetical protein
MYSNGMNSNGDEQKEYERINRLLYWRACQEAAKPESKEENVEKTKEENRRH